MNKKNRKEHTVLLLLCLVFLGIAVFSGYKVISTLLEYREGEKIYSELQQHIQIPVPSTQPTQEDLPTGPEGSITTKPESTEPATEATKPSFVSPVDFDSLWAINPDVVGWIYIEGTKINYPIVQGSSNETYLYHLINGKYNRSGSIFMDYRNASDYSDQNTVIYGHHMADGSMFADLVDYGSQSFFESHRTGFLFTPLRTYTLTFFAGYVTDVWDDAWQMSFSSDAEFSQWLQDSIARSAFDSGVLPSVSQHIFTLSTCTYEYNNARFVLAAIME